MARPLTRFADRAAICRACAGVLEHDFQRDLLRCCLCGRRVTGQYIHAYVSRRAFRLRRWLGI